MSNESERDGRRLTRQSLTRQSLTRQCRAFLRQGMDDLALTDQSLREHIANCEFCSARSAARIRLIAALSLRSVPVPPQLHSAAFLDEIRARIVEASEETQIGRLLSACMPVAPPSAAGDACWPAALLESDLGRRTMAVPDPAEGPTWDRVKASVLEDVTSQRAHRLRRQSAQRNRGLTLAGVAVAAIICSWLVSERAQSPPQIVITDVVSMPNLEFSPMTVLRRGEQR